jgi:hypothetical protein
VAYRAGAEAVRGYRAPDRGTKAEAPLGDDTLQELLGTYTAGQCGEASPDPGGVDALGGEHRPVAESHGPMHPDLCDPPSVEGGGQVKAELVSVGQSGEQSLKRIETACGKASGGLKDLGREAELLRTGIRTPVARSRA